MQESRMHILNERRTVALDRRPDRVVEGTLRIRGLDAMVGTRGVRIERRTAEWVAIRHGDNVRTMALPPSQRGRRWLTMIAFPAAAFALTRLVAQSGRRGR
jgi:hypothetical protein